MYILEYIYTTHIISYKIYDQYKLILAEQRLVSFHRIQVITNQPLTCFLIIKMLFDRAQRTWTLQNTTAIKQL